MLGSVPQRLGPYELLRQIGSGGMAIVYLGRDTRSDQQVAIKVMSNVLSVDPRFRQRFQREAELAIRVDSPHVVKTLDFGMENGTPYLVMEYARGVTLGEHIDAVGALPVEEAVDYATQIARGLETAHQMGVVHRDIKTQNLMLTKGVMKIMDFGIARDVDATRSSTKMFTPHYASPEQIRGTPPPDHRSDIYSLGVVLYHLLAGKVPFTANSEFEIARMHIEDLPPPILRHRPEVSQALRAVVEKMLAKDPGERHQNARELLSELIAVSGDAGIKDVSDSSDGDATRGGGTPGTGDDRVRDTPDHATGKSSRPIRILMITIIALLAIGGAVALLLNLSSPESAAELAEGPVGAVPEIAARNSSSAARPPISPTPLSGTTGGGRSPAVAVVAPADTPTNTPTSAPTNSPTPPPTATLTPTLTPTSIPTVLPSIIDFVPAGESIHVVHDRIELEGQVVGRAGTDDAGRPLSGVVVRIAFGVQRILSTRTHQFVLSPTNLNGVFRGYVPAENLDVGAHYLDAWVESGTLSNGAVVSKDGSSGTGTRTIHIVAPTPTPTPTPTPVPPILPSIVEFEPQDGRTFLIGGKVSISGRVVGRAGTEEAGMPLPGVVVAFSFGPEENCCDRSYATSIFPTDGNGYFSGDLVINRTGPGLYYLDAWVTGGNSYDGRVISTDGLHGTGPWTFYVEEPVQPAPIAYIDEPAASISVPHNSTVQFRGRGQSPTGLPITGYSWGYNGQPASGEASFNWQITQSGTMTLKVRDSKGTWSETAATVAISMIAPTATPIPPTPTPRPTATPVPAPTATPAPSSPANLITSTGIAVGDQCVAGGGVQWAGSIPGNPLPYRYCYVFVVNSWPAGWTYSSVWQWPSGHTEYSTTRDPCPTSACSGWYIKIGWRAPGSIYRSPGTLRISLYVNGDWVRTDSFTVS